MKINQAGIELIKSFEGLKLDSYKCPSGVWTCGYGATGDRVKPGLNITAAQAEQWLAEDLQKFEEAVSRLVKVSLNENEFSALVSFAYNCGESALAGSTALKRLNAGDRAGCCEALLWWTKGSGGQVLEGLARRRKAEVALFQTAVSYEPLAVSQKIQKANSQQLVANSFLLDSYRYYKDLPHQKQAIAYLEQHVPAEVMREMQLRWRSVATEVPVEIAPKVITAANKPERLVDKIVAYMGQKGYVLYTAAGKRNIVYVEGMKPDGTLNDDRPNWFNDIRCVFEFRNGKPEMLGIWVGTTEPGSKYTHKPMNPKGCARIAFGQYKQAWAVGMHGTKDRHEALVQVGTITVHRDLNKDFQRTGDKLDIGSGFAVNQHWGGDNAESDIGYWSAGCLVGRTREGHKQFMRILKEDPDYKSNKGYRFTTTVIPGDELVKLYG